MSRRRSSTSKDLLLEDLYYPGIHPLNFDLNDDIDYVTSCIMGGGGGQSQQFLVRSTDFSFSRSSHLKILVFIIMFLKCQILGGKIIFFNLSFNTN